MSAQEGEQVLAPAAGVVDQDAGAPTTLSQRRAQQTNTQAQEEEKRPSMAEGMYLTRDGQVEFKPEYLSRKLEEVLGFNSYTLFESQQEEQEIRASMNQFQIEELIMDREQKRNQLREKMYLRMKALQPQIKKELEAQRGGAAPTRGRGRQPASSTQQQRGRKQSGSGDEFSSSSSSSSSGRSGSSSSYSGSGSSSSSSRSYSSRSSDSRQKLTAPVPPQNPEAGGNYYEDDDNLFDVHIDGKKQVEVKPRPPQTDQQAKISKYVESLEDLKKIVLKRQQLEQWVEEQFNFFFETVVGAWVRFNYKGKDRIAIVVSAREEDDQHNYLPLYTMGKKKTNIQVLIKYGSGTIWFRLDRISNSDPTHDEFYRMIENFKNPAPVKAMVDGVPKMVTPSELDSLSYSKFAAKLSYLERLKKEGPPKYTPDQVEEMVNHKLERRLRDGRSGTINLPYEKTRIDGDIGLVERNLEKARKTVVGSGKKDTTIQAFEAKLAYLYRLRDLLDNAVLTQKQRNLETVDLADGQKRTIEDVEAELAMREWLQKQQMKLRHPEIKHNTFFMHNVGSGMLQRENSLSLQKQGSILGKRASSSLNLEEDLQLIQIENQRYAELCKEETFFQRQQRLKKAHQDFHANSFNFEGSLFATPDSVKALLHSFGGESSHFERPLAKPHPSWQQAMEQEQFNQVMRLAAQPSDIVTFEQYFNQA